jgi:hypothetical protein
MLLEATYGYSYTFSLPRLGASIEPANGSDSKTVALAFLPGY